MDPYLESPTQWSDFHHRFVDDLADAINGALPGNYLARIDERLMLVTPMEDPPDRSNFRPDVTVVRSSGGGSRGGAGTGAAVLEPVTLENLDVIDPHTESYIKIVRLPDQELVTVIELLSPTNKYGEGRGDYVRKRRKLLRQPVHIVELDLLRAGPRLEFAQALPPADYYAFVSRVEARNKTDAFAWAIRDPLPTIPIPLRKPDPDVLLDLAAPFAETYRRGQYWKLINYQEAPPAPSFQADDTDWVAARSREGAR
jgi:hypothetical protein